MEGNFCGFTCSGNWCGEGFYLLSWWDCVGVMFHLDCGLSLFSGTLTDSYSPVLCVCQVRGGTKEFWCISYVKSAILAIILKELACVKVFYKSVI